MAVVAVTGATGYVGSAVVGGLEAAGHTCVLLGRRGDGSSREWRRYVLGEPIPQDLFDGCDALVHAAYDLTETRAATSCTVNLGGSVSLLQHAHAGGVRRLVFVSSMSAYAGTKQLYGSIKLEIERTVEQLGGLSLRLGLVYSANAGGMVGALQKVMSLPIVPVIGSKSYQYTIGLDDVVQAAVVSVEDDTLRGTVGVAFPRRVPVPELMRVIARSAGRAPRFVTVPWHPLLIVMRAAEALRVRLPFRSESVLGLVRPAPDVPRVDEWARRDIHLLDPTRAGQPT